MEKLFSVVRYMAVACVCLGLAACASTPSPTGGEGEKLIWTSHKERPDWINQEVKADEKFLYFVGISSEAVADQQIARKQALANARKQVVNYCGTMVRDKTEKTLISFGLSSTVVDPTVAGIDFEKQFSANVAKMVKAKEWYEEKWEKPTGVGWKVYALCKVPKDIVNESLQNTASSNIQKAREAARKADTDAARKQARDAIRFWSKMKEEQLIE